MFKKILASLLCLCLIAPEPVLLADFLAPPSSSGSTDRQREYQAAENFLRLMQELRKKWVSADKKKSLMPALRNSLAILLGIPGLGLAQTSSELLLLRREKPGAPWHAFGRLIPPAANVGPEDAKTFHPQIVFVPPEVSAIYAELLKVSDVSFFGPSQGTVVAEAFPEYLELSRVLLETGASASRVLVSALGEKTDLVRGRLDQMLQCPKEDPQRSVYQDRLNGAIEGFLDQYDKLNPAANPDVYIPEYPLNDDIDPGTTTLRLALAKEVYEKYGEYVKPFRELGAKRQMQKLSGLIRNLKFALGVKKNSLTHDLQFGGSARILMSDLGENRLVVTFGQAMVRVQSPPLTGLPLRLAEITAASPGKSPWKFLLGAILLNLSLARPAAAQGLEYSLPAWLEGLSQYLSLETALTLLGVATAGAVAFAARGPIQRAWFWTVDLAQGLFRRYTLSLPAEWNMPSHGKFTDARLLLLTQGDPSELETDPQRREQYKQFLGRTAWHQLRSLIIGRKVARRLGFDQASGDMVGGALASHDCWKRRADVVRVINVPVELTNDEKAFYLGPYRDTSERILRRAAKSVPDVTPEEFLLVRHHRQPARILSDTDGGNIQQRYQLLRLCTIVYAANRIDQHMNQSHPFRPQVEMTDLGWFLDTEILEHVRQQVREELRQGVQGNRWSPTEADDVFLRYSQFLRSLSLALVTSFQEREEEFNRLLEGKSPEEQIRLLINAGSTPEQFGPFNVPNLMFRLGMDEGRRPEVEAIVRGLIVSGEVAQLYRGRLVSRGSLNSLIANGLVRTHVVGDVVTDGVRKEQTQWITEFDVATGLEMQELKEVWHDPQGSVTDFHGTQDVERLVQSGALIPIRISARENVQIIYADPATHSAMLGQGSAIPVLRLDGDRLVTQYVYGALFAQVKERDGWISVVEAPIPGSRLVRETWVYKDQLSELVKMGLVTAALRSPGEEPSAQEHPEQHVWVVAEAQDVLIQSGWGQYALLRGGKEDWKGTRVFLHPDGMGDIRFRRAARIHRIKEIVALYSDTRPKELLPDKLIEALRQGSPDLHPKTSNELRQLILSCVDRPNKTAARRALDLLSRADSTMDDEQRQQAVNLLLPAFKKIMAQPTKREKLQKLAQRHFARKEQNDKHLIVIAYKLAAATYGPLESDLGGFVIDEVLSIATSLAVPIETRVPASYVAAALLLHVPRRKHPGIPAQVWDWVEDFNRLKGIGYLPPPHVSKKRWYVRNFRNMLLKTAQSLPALLLYLVYQYEYLNVQSQREGVDFSRRHALLVDICSGLAKQLGLDRFSESIRNRIFARAHPARYREFAERVHKKFGLDHQDLTIYAELLEAQIQRQLRLAKISGQAVVRPVDFTRIGEQWAAGQINPEDMDNLSELMTVRIVVKAKDAKEAKEAMGRVCGLELPVAKEILQEARGAMYPFGIRVMGTLMPLNIQELGVWLDRKKIPGVESEGPRNRFKRINTLVAHRNGKRPDLPLRLIIQTREMQARELAKTRLASVYHEGTCGDPLNPTTAKREVPDATAQIEKKFGEMQKDPAVTGFEYVRYKSPATTAIPAGVERIYHVPRRTSDLADPLPRAEDVLVLSGPRALGVFAKKRLKLNGEPLKTLDQRVRTPDLLEEVTRPWSQPELAGIDTRPTPTRLSEALWKAGLSAEQLGKIRAAKLWQLAVLVRSATGRKIEIVMGDESQSVPAEIVPAGDTETTNITGSELEEMLIPDLRRWGLEGPQPLTECCLMLYMDELKMEDVADALLIRRGRALLLQAGMDLDNASVRSNLPRIASRHFSQPMAAAMTSKADDEQKLTWLVGAGKLDLTDLVTAVETDGKETLHKYRVLGRVIIGGDAMEEDISGFASPNQVQAFQDRDLTVRGQLGVPTASIISYLAHDGDIAAVSARTTSQGEPEMRLPVTLSGESPLFLQAVRRAHRHGIVLRENLLGPFSVDPALQGPLVDVLCFLADILDYSREQTWPLAIGQYQKEEQRAPQRIQPLREILQWARTHGKVDTALIKKIISFFQVNRNGLFWEIPSEGMDRLIAEGPALLNRPEFVNAILPRLLGVRDDYWSFDVLDKYRQTVDPALWGTNVRQNIAAMQTVQHTLLTMQDWWNSKLMAMRVEVDILQREGEKQVTGQDRQKSWNNLQLSYDEMQVGLDELKRCVNPTGITPSHGISDLFQFDRAKISKQEEISPDVPPEDLSVMRRAVQGTVQQVEPFIQDIRELSAQWEGLRGKSAEEGHAVLAQTGYALERMQRRLADLARSDEGLNKDFVLNRGAVEFPRLLNHGSIAAPLGGLDLAGLAANYVRKIAEDPDNQWELISYCTDHRAEAVSLMKAIFPKLSARVQAEWLSKALGMKKDTGPWAQVYMEERPVRTTEKQSEVIAMLGQILSNILETNPAAFGEIMKELPSPQPPVHRETSWLGIQEPVDQSHMRLGDWADLIGNFEIKQWKLYLAGREAAEVERMGDIVSQFARTLADFSQDKDHAVRKLFGLSMALLELGVDNTQVDRNRLEWDGRIEVLSQVVTLHYAFSTILLAIRDMTQDKPEQLRTIIRSWLNFPYLEHGFLTAIVAQGDSEAAKADPVILFVQEALKDMAQKNPEAAARIVQGVLKVFVTSKKGRVTTEATEYVLSPLIGPALDAYLDSTEEPDPAVIVQMIRDAGQGPSTDESLATVGVTERSG